MAAEELSRRDPGPLRTAIVGVGHELLGDDAAGVLVARKLATRCVGDDRLLVLEGGPAPEKCTGALRRFGPELVIMIDSAEMGVPPGTLRWLDWSAAEGVSASTHTLPLNLFARYLSAELHCRVALLAIQPGPTWPGAPLSPAVERAIATALLMVEEALPRASACSG